MGMSSSMLFYKADIIITYRCLDCCYGIGTTAHEHFELSCLEYDLSVLKLIVEDSTKGYTLLEGTPISKVLGAIIPIFLVCLGWSLFNKWQLDNWVLHLLLQQCSGLFHATGKGWQYRIWLPFLLKFRLVIRPLGGFSDSKVLSLDLSQLLRLLAYFSGKASLQYWFDSALEPSHG